MENIKKIDFLFETSWEVCNKIGGIHTVITTKALTLQQKLKDNFIFVGPDLNKHERNLEFEEDQELFKSWRTIIKNQGIRVKIGRWKIIGTPIVFLVDFSSLFTKKNEIFSKLWEDFKVDSLSGSWEYTEAVMFGQTAAMVIESFHNFHLNVRQNVVAHFHEWTTGSGLLYLKKNVPQISTAFTTHATTLGRSIAGNNLPLYVMMKDVNGDIKAKELNVSAKHSLEKAAATEADVFTTVSDLTANEAKLLLEKSVDIVTPNGFETNIVPTGKNYEKIKSNSWQKLRKVSEALLGYQLSDSVKFVSTSGRYEYKNKGIDVFIDVFAELNRMQDFENQVIAFVLTPANNYGARKDLSEKLQGFRQDDLENKFLTHNLHDAEYDQILRKIKELGFTNGQEQNIKIIFVPAYLNGNDGIFDIKYYDLLPAFDMTIYPSYYEPWGYTPLESLAFHVPTITTSLTGFGVWLSDSKSAGCDCFSVVNRDDESCKNVVQNIKEIVEKYILKTSDEKENIRNNALRVSQTAQWSNFINYYYKAYALAIAKTHERREHFNIKQMRQNLEKIPKLPINSPKWRAANVLPKLPNKLVGLDELSKNLWWEWNAEAKSLFETIDKELWEANQNPIKLLKEVSYERLTKLENDSDFLFQFDKVYQNFKKYINAEPDKKLPAISYFSMEYGIANLLKIFSGGLGILAGDYMKQASDKNIRMIGVGLLYKFGYFSQKLSIRGEQIVEYEQQNFADLPVELVLDENKKPLRVQVGFPGRVVNVQVWKVRVGRIPLFLLDTDVEENNPEDRSITHKLYGGDNEHRLKQEIVLGIGGIKMLRKLQIRTNVYHSNEGHAAFIGIERIDQYMHEHRLTFAEALEIIRASTLFTTHTPVGAGHDEFSEELMMSYLGYYPERLKISWEEFLNLGKIDTSNKNEKFSMSYLAANLSQEVNGVSYLHGEVTKSMFVNLWKGYFPEELHIGYVTNGVHYPTWAAKEWKNLLFKHFEGPIEKLGYDKEIWNRIYDVADNEIWEIREKLRGNLVDFLKKRINSHFVKQRKSPQQIVAIQNKLKKNILTFGFARRFATYKRAHLLFADIDRLAKILNNPERPAQIIFAGKAHPRDKQGQDLIKYITEISKKPEFLGKILFLENYDIEVAKRMVQGVDVWINTPKRPLEASGTSGMKAVMNGVLNLSVLDGWWVEGYKENAGWALPQENTYNNDEFQNQLDAEMIYEIMENEIVPMFYNRDADGIPRQWIQFIKKNIAQIAPDFTSARMLDDYSNRFYVKLANRKAELRKEEFKMAYEISAWKKRMLYSWESIKPKEADNFNYLSQQMKVGEAYNGRVVLDLPEINPECIGVELLIVEKNVNDIKILERKELTLEKYENHEATFILNSKPENPGIYKYAFRIFPKNKFLPHRQDFPLVMWI